MEHIDEPVRRVFASSNSEFFKSLSELGFSKIEYLRDPLTNKALFYYDENTFDIEKKDFLASAGKVYAIVLLEGRQKTLEPLLEKSPKNLIVLPVLKPKILSDKTYILKSFAYKIINFSQDAQPYELLGLSKSTLYMGFDISHEHQKRQSHYAFSAVDNTSKILHLSQLLNLPLNERIDLQTLQIDIVKSINAYQTRYKQLPKRVLLMRDGLFFEDKDLLKNLLELLGVEYAAVEINKDNQINSETNLKCFLIQLEPTRFIYFSQTYNLQKAVEINIVLNKSSLSNEQLAKEIYLTTRLYHHTPYTNLKLPYPLYITDKVAKYTTEWKLYVSYFVIL